MNTPPKVRFGILGAARIVERMLPALLQCPLSEVVAIASRRPGAAAEVLAKTAPDLKEVSIYDDLDALLNDPRVDAVYIPLANHEHGQWALKAVQRGKHVLCEKPMAICAADIDAIEQEAARQGVIAMEGFMYRFHPQHERVKELVDAGYIGEIRAVHAHFSFMMRPARLYRLAESTAKGGGAMWDIGPYAIHAARWFFEEPPRSVLATAKYVESGADITTSGVLDFGDGKQGVFDVSFEWSRQSSYTLIGTQGGIKCHAAWVLPEEEPVISWWTEDGKQAHDIIDKADHFVLEVRHFCESILRKKQPLLSLQDAKYNCMTIEAVLESAAAGIKVHLDN